MGEPSDNLASITDRFDQPGDPGWTEMPGGSADAAPIDFSAARREAQRRENIEIGEGSDTVPTARIYTLDDMLAELVLITDGSQIAPLNRPRAVLKLADFKNATAGSKHYFEVEGKMKSVPAVKAWLEHPARLEAEALTFRAGGTRMTRAPETGKAALNLWVAPARRKPPKDWQDRAQPFVDHIQWLWGEHTDDFLDWLAHIEQQPGTLPHFGWVHISREHGKGRNWISSVLARVWAGYVAASLDLVSILEGGFNGRMSQKLLAIVDEINEGGNTSYRHAQRLRAIVTEEYRDINPKYGHQRQEYNSCRWLMFSNHTGAIPLGEDDRRFWIVSHEGEPKDIAYYAHLYGQLRDPYFIASVAEMLRRRDVSAFKPGARPPMTDAKAALISMSQTEDDNTLQDVASGWPVDLITGLELTNLLEGRLALAATRFAIDRAGLRKIDKKVKVPGQGTQTVFSIRNHGVWKDADHQKRAAHVDMYSEEDKRQAIGRDMIRL